MSKGISLRVAEGIELSPELRRTLAELLPDFKLETFKAEPTYQQNYQRRVDSLNEAFLFILRAYPLDPEFTTLTTATLTEYARACKASCDLAKGSVDELQEELRKYTAKLVDVLSLAWKWPDTKAVEESIACLNEAEQYVLMGKGRDDIATLTPMTFGDATEYVLQFDKVIPPHYEQWIAELELIRESSYPKTPVWFQGLAEYQQAYFCNLDLPIINPDELINDFNGFLLEWERAKSNPNFAKDFPKCFDGLSLQIKEILKVLAPLPIAEIELKLIEFKKKLEEQKLQPEYLDTLRQVTKIPQWYWVLPHRQQCFLEHTLKQERDIRDAVSFLSSRHRTLPVPANFAVHSLFRINARGTHTQLGGKSYRSSHIASRDMLKAPLAVQKRHASSIFAKVREEANPEIPAIMQTLISPIPITEYAPSQIADHLPDWELHQLGRSVVSDSKLPNVWQHNHPLNVAKIFAYTASNNADSLRLIEMAKAYLPNPELEVLLADYQGVLGSALGSATIWDYNGRELFLSSLEQLITFAIGGHSYGSCVSGKDRKGLALIHTDAMLLYKDRYGSWPKFDTPPTHSDRARFVAIVVDLHCSRHQQENAGRNAPGSEAIKTPDKYWPQDIAAEINRRWKNSNALEHEDRVASNNEVKAIGLKDHLLRARGRFVAEQIGREGCLKLYDALNDLINEKSQFERVKRIWPLRLFEGNLIPEGIQSIEALMRNRDAGNNVERMAQIVTIVLNRPSANATRTAATVSVYDGIRGLCEVVSDKHELDTRVNALEREWITVFENSKAQNIEADADADAETAAVTI